MARDRRYTHRDKGGIVPFRRKKKASGEGREEPKLLLIGTRLQTRPIEMLLADIRAHTISTEWHDQLRDGIDDATAAVVFIEPLPRINITQATKLLRDDLQRHGTALFAIMGEGLTDSRARRIYDSGATAVFEWPREAEQIPRLVAEMLAIELVRGKTTGSDRALNRSIEARLKSVAGPTSGVRVGTEVGIAFLSGVVDSLWKKKKIEEVISRIPGVKGVVSRHLRVQSLGLSDRAVANKVRGVLRSTSDIDATTISLSVRNGTVILAGSAVDRSELEHLNEVIRHVKGVRDIENLVTISKSQKEKDHIVSRRINTMLSRLFPHKHVSASVFSGVAVLSGQVDLLKTRAEIGESVGEDHGVERVINKIAVA